MSSIIDSIQARVAQLAGPADEPAETESASEPAEAAPPAAGGSGADSASADASTTGAPIVDPKSASPEATTTAPDEDERKTRHQLMEERLREVRERRAAARLRAEAEADRKAAAEEKAKYEGLRNGSFLETVKALGRDPREVFEEMKTEAIRAGTPEAKIELMERRFAEQLRETVEPLKKTIEELTAREKQLAEQHEAMQFRSAFDQTLQDEAFTSLRIEYDEDRLFSIVEGLKRSPAEVIENAKKLGVRLTYPDGRYTMRDILSVLKAAQDEHERVKEARRAKLAPPPPPATQAAQAPAGTKTVNGTTDRRNAGNPLGNESASARATDSSSRPRETRLQRINRLASGG